eukprot:TRINITY_DN3653_c0_g1_i3.p1 TRINITY_DN3653_c0_g1~~TRINITY_DN3653_c0_g1_i3.p1  ORF type:complete len:725 (+),score=125.57 TRINITY_DN3653_c0_g1_i3:628-2802(+)
MGSRKAAGVGYAGWVFHLGTNSLGISFCHARFLKIERNYVTMYKRDPQESSNSVPLRKGRIGPYLLVEDLGRQIYHDRILYGLRIFSRIDHTRQGRFGCSNAEEVVKWMGAFQQAKEEAESEEEKSGSHRIISSEDEFQLNGPRGHSRSYSSSLTKFIMIGRGPESLLRRPTVIAREQEPESYNFGERDGDTVDQADWRCFVTVNGLRIFEDVAASKQEKGTIMKSVGVVEATADALFDMIMSCDPNIRKQWDILTADLELVEYIDGHADIVYGTFDPKFVKKWITKRDFVFSRYWRRNQDGSYSITQISATHKDRPPKSGFHRMDLNPGIWEIAPLPGRPGSGTPRSLVTQIMEVKSTGWGRWRKSDYSKFHKTVPYVMLCRIAGLRELFAAKPELCMMPTEDQSFAKVSPSKGNLSSNSSISEVDALENCEEFFDAIMVDEPADEGEVEKVQTSKSGRQRFKSVSWGVVVGLTMRRQSVHDDQGELLYRAPAVQVDRTVFKGSLPRGRHDKDTDCWFEPNGKGFMIRGVTYMQDSLKVAGGDPLLKLLAVDWFRCEGKVDKSPEGKKAPFILVVNLQVPASPNYSLVFYFVADRPVRDSSLLHRFVNGDDAFRNSRFKLIPSIVEGYWVVKRAVGTKACLLGKAVTCHYLREENFLEIDVDIGSSSVARSVIGLVLGYVSSIVVDLAILIEAKDDKELPEYILGITRVARVKLETAASWADK